MKRKNIKLYIAMLTVVSMLGMSGCTLSISIGKRPDTSNQGKTDTPKVTDIPKATDTPSVTDIPKTTPGETGTDEKKEEVQPSEAAKEITQEPDSNNEDEGQKLVKNISADLNVRKYPRHKSDLVAVVSNGQLMYFYGEKEQGYGSDEIMHDWYKIYLENGISGWVRSDLVTEADPDTDSAEG